MFWIAAGLLTALTIIVVIYPLTRKERQMASADSYDFAIYKSQLKEIDGDVERGLIDPAEADAARAEVARRLFQSQSALDRDAGEGMSNGKDSNLSRGMGFAKSAKVAAVVAGMFVPLVSLGLYFMIGSPDLQSQPLAERPATSPGTAKSDRAGCIG